MKGDDIYINVSNNKCENKNVENHNNKKLT